MDERVVPVLPGVEWEPNEPRAVLVQDDRGRACLALAAHFADPDDRCVVFVWTGCHRVVMGSPNDEALDRHRLYGTGLQELLWTGEVEGSSWIEELAAMAARPPAKHYVVPTKEAVIEVVADDIAVLRLDGPTADAALEALAS